MERIGIYEWTVVFLGMGTTFVALIGLSWILSLFSFVARLRERRSAGAKAGGGSGDAETHPGSAPAPAGSIPPAVVAAITAAIAAAGGRRVSDFRITRIVPSAPVMSGMNTPVWGYADRLAAGRR